MTDEEAEAICRILELVKDETTLDQRAILVQSAIAEKGPFPDEFGPRVRGLLST